MTEVYIHIGMPKAGSTSIQNTLFLNREQLAKHGVGYLNLAKNHSRILYTLFGSERDKKREKRKRKGFHPVTKRVLGLKQDAIETDAATLAHLFDRELASNTMPKFVLSGEGLYGFGRERAERLREHLSDHFDNIRIIVYIRDPLSWASSLAQNAIKNGHTTLATIYNSETAGKGISSFLVEYRRNIEPYIDVFGRDFVDMRVFDRTRFADGDLLADFCSAIGRPEIFSEIPKLFLNTSLCYESTILVSQYNERFGAPDIKPSRPDLMAFRKRLDGIEGTRFSLPKEILEHVWLAVADDVAWLREEMGEDVFGEAYPPEAITGPIWSTATLQQIHRTGIELIAGADGTPTLATLQPNWKTVESESRSGNGQLFAASLRSMMRIIARRVNAATLRAWRS